MIQPLREHTQEYKTETKRQAEEQRTKHNDQRPREALQVVLLKIQLSKIEINFHLAEVNG